MAAGNDDDEGGGGGDGDPELCTHEAYTGPGGRRSLEKALEEATATGVLNLSGRRMKELPGSARNSDLTDVTRADLSRNRLSELPVELSHLVSLESLCLYHNCLRTLPPSVSNLQVLSYLNLSRNLLTSLPPHICRLPLTVLIASNNKLTSIPEEVGGMGSLRQLDLSCNELQSLPAQMGALRSLRELNVRRNQLSSLPEEISELPLTRLDFSCNRVARIPPSFCRLRHLQSIVLDNNPLQYPPAQICLKGKVHIFKYLNIEACSKSAPELEKLSRPTSFTTCLTDDLYSQPYGGLDSGFNSVDSGSKRWSGNESADELSDLSFRVSGLGRDVRQFKEKLNGAANGENELPDFMDSSTNDDEEGSRGGSGPSVMAAPQEQSKPERHSTPRPEERHSTPRPEERHSTPRPEERHSTPRPEERHSTPRPEERHSTPRPEERHSTPRPEERHSTPRPEERTLVCRSEPSPPGTRQDLATEERRRPETLLIWKERERQQLQQRQEVLRRPSVDRRESIQKTPSCTSSSPQSHSETTNSVPGVSSDGCSRLRSQGSQTELLKPQSPSETSASSVQKPNSFLFRSCSRGAVRSAAGSEQSSASSSPVRLRSPHPRIDEKTAVLQLRKDIESLLNITLEDPLCESLCNGVTLCRLLNHLRPRTIPIINVPSPAVPKLNLVKCRKNVDSFLDACRRLGVPEDDICSPYDILEGEGLGRLFITVQSLFQQSMTSPKP
ncbi:leucine-rich repeat and calponin homology domain-containing protein 4 isoform 2-T2 [Anomaloglossus baeobatrachus]|uniref:leucine-rich repeat and calponin homology domain-containing protein 4 isoform X2 n=1 Tax=Anomaloglossus baeobatrachus TaxID=238106 RepID=UPI003F50BF62